VGADSPSPKAINSRYIFSFFYGDDFDAGNSPEDPCGAFGPLFFLTLQLIRLISGGGSVVYRVQAPSCFPFSMLPPPFAPPPSSPKQRWFLFLCRPFYQSSVVSHQRRGLIANHERFLFLTMSDWRRLAPCIFVMGVLVLPLLVGIFLFS